MFDVILFDVKLPVTVTLPLILVAEDEISTTLLVPVVLIVTLLFGLTTTLLFPFTNDIALVAAIPVILLNY